MSGREIIADAYRDMESTNSARIKSLVINDFRDETPMNLARSPLPASAIAFVVTELGEVLKPRLPAALESPDIMHFRGRPASARLSTAVLLHVNRGARKRA